MTLIHPIYSDTLYEVAKYHHFSSPEIALNQTVKKFLNDISSEYCKLIDTNQFSAQTPILLVPTKETVVTLLCDKISFFKRFTRTNVMELMTFNKVHSDPCLTFEALKKGTIAVSAPQHLNTKIEGKTRLCKLLDNLKKVKSVQQLLICIEKSECLKGSNFTRYLTPTILEMQYLKLKNGEVITVAEALNKWKFDFNKEELALQICAEAAGNLDINQSHSIQQLFYGAQPTEFEGNKQHFKDVQICLGMKNCALT